MPNHYVGDLLLTIGMSGLSRVRTELLHLAVVQTLTPHPVQMHRQKAGGAVASPVDQRRSVRTVTTTAAA